MWQKVMMPSPRVMGDMLLLPTGDVLVINGAKRGTAGSNQVTSLGKSWRMMKSLKRKKSTGGCNMRSRRWIPSLTNAISTVEPRPRRLCHFDSRQRRGRCKQRRYEFGGRTEAVLHGAEECLRQPATWRSRRGQHLRVPKSVEEDFRSGR
ncbi:hypothetical protein EZV62_008648 [Acer yangbiense]|uniref:Glyoxal oxidase N-terminal domain-containing protein n=1 Tax=Acer yangbiense TaxID=1000413 RepID=A0A5C7IDJ8_9ROSI|nr:hypothetical protein EZV62_008648 [Acer yangbiense]